MMTQDEIIRMAREAGVWDEIGYPKCIERFAALVAEHWIETNKALAKEIIELKKQAEQKPVGYVYMKDFRNVSTPAGYVYMKDFLNVSTKDVALTKDVPVGTKLYAAPVRTKDLTDDELYEFYESNKKFGVMCAFYEFEEIARDVIAADRENNK